MNMKALLILNPLAGRILFEKDHCKSTALLEEAGWQVTVRRTEFPGHGVSLAREGKDRYDLVVACGGDGTVNEVVNGLAGSPTPLGVIPMGTVNIWALETGISRNPVKAAELLLRGQIRTVDLGLAGQRFFLLMAGLGFDGHVARLLHPGMKRLLGIGAYLGAGATAALRYAGAPAQLEVDGKHLTAQLLWLVVGNTRLYGGLIKITPQAKIDDGLLDICLFKGERGIRILSYLWAVGWRYHTSIKGIEYYRCKEITVHSEKPLPTQVDGDPLGTTPVTFRVVPQALRAILPPGLPQGLFSTN